MSITAAIPLFPEFTALDAIGPYDVLQRTPDIDVVFVGHERGEVRSDNGFLGIVSPVPIRRIEFNEDAGGDDMCLYAFRFGFEVP